MRVPVPTVPPDCSTCTPASRPDIASANVVTVWFWVIVGMSMLLVAVPASRARCSPAGVTTVTTSSETAAALSPKSTVAFCPVVTAALPVAAP